MRRLGTLRNKTAQWLALAALAYGGFFLAPQSCRADPPLSFGETDFISSLEQNLDALGGQRLSGTSSASTPFRMRQCALPHEAGTEKAAATGGDFPLSARRMFPLCGRRGERVAAAMNASPPQVLVVSSAL